MASQEYVGLLIASARRRIKQVVLARAAPHRLASQQFWTLVALLENPAMSQTDLAERLRSDPPTVSRVVGSLSRRRLVRADVDVRDRRRVCLALTPSGERLARELQATARELRASMTSGMTAAEVDALRRGLRRVITNLDRFAAPRAGASRARDLP